MKNTKLFVISTALLAASFTCMFFLPHAVNRDKASAYSHTTKGNLPTTLNLGDNSESDIRSYYSALSSLSENERKGDNLLKNLKPILSNGQRYYSYDADSGKSNCIWLMYEIIDRDWVKSPISDITNSSSDTYISGASYNSGTKTLSGYKYGATDPFVHALYYDREYENYMTAWYNHSPRTKEFVMEREHIWPKSHGFDTELETTGGARGDPMHLWAAEGYTNGIHSNYYYGNVDKDKSYTNCGDYALTTYTVYSTTEYAHHNYLGTSLSLGSGTVFEPQDSDKGDIARAVFYMAARYNNIAGALSGIDANEPNLYLNDVIDLSTGTSTASTAYNLGLLHDLLEWHHNDPVDEFEIHRNNLLFNNYTNNRNPFIDYPEWADFIWGTPEDGMTYSEPTGYASPSTDTINGYNVPTPPTPTGDPIDVSLSISDYASDNSWTNGTKYTSINLDENITASVAGGSNSGKYYTDGNTWRIYQSESPTFTISAASGYVIDSVTLTFGLANTGTLVDSSSNVIESESEVDVGSSSVSFYVSNSTSATNGQVRITNISVTYHAASVITSITASVDKDFYVGDTITKSDITVTNNLGGNVADFTFSDYQFTYADAPSGGATTTKNFLITYEDLEDTLTVNVSRKEYEAPDDVIHSLTTANSDFSSIEVTSGASAVTNTLNKNGISYIATLSYKYNNKLSFKTYGDGNDKYKSDGVLYNNTAYSTSIKSVTLTQDNSIPYTVEYSNDKSSWTTTNDGNMHHFQISFKSSFIGYINITAVTITLNGEESPINVANFIMFEDTNNQCETKFDEAVILFSNMTSLGRSTFMTSSDYVISTARTRFEAWATNQGKSIDLVAGDYVVNSAFGVNQITNISYNESTGTIIIIAVITLLSITSIACFLIKKKSA